MLKWGRTNFNIPCLIFNNHYSHNLYLPTNNRSYEPGAKPQ
jgi:hypothetical protein